MPFTIHTSNRLETLFDLLANRLAKGLHSPFERETIAVQNQGMDRWLSLRFAEKFKVWAGCEYPFPGKLIYDIFKRSFRELADPEPLAEPLLAWKIMEALPRLKSEPGFSPVEQYLKDDASGVKLFQLSGKLSKLFDDYQIYRPEKVLSWDAQAFKTKNEAEAWQQRLWKEITRELEKNHRAALQKSYLRKLEIAKPGEIDAPRRITVFGISYLAPFHFSVLQALGEKIDVSMYFLSPSKDYWGELFSGKERAREAVKRGRGEEELLLEKGNPLLAEMGRMGREFHGFVLDRTSQTDDHFADPGCGSLLHTLQSDILNNRLRAPGSGQSGSGFREPVALSEEDFSLQIHDCHSPVRELEVLHDNLIRLFEALPGLQPRDVLVMAPDIEIYAPFVRAVFDREVALKVSGGTFKLPVSVADRPMGTGLAAAGLLLRLLKFDHSRFTITEITDILEAAPVRLKFSLSMDDCATIRGWLEDTAVRWGRDSGHRKVIAGCTTEENTWKQAFERMFLGYAMPGSEAFGPENILVYPKIEGNTALLLGRLRTFYEILCKLAETLQKPGTIDEWTIEAQGILDDLMLEDRENPAGISALREELKIIRENAVKAEYDTPVALPVFRALIGEKLKASFRGGGFLKEGITFCALQPMRSVPFRVIVLLGMNNGDFPGRQEPFKFNLMAEERKPGDKDKAYEDRYLFLETLLSARDALLISFVGRSIKDNKDKLPSSCVSALLDTLDNMVARNKAVPEKKREAGKSPLVIRHPLHPFSAKYFSNQSKSLFSYSPAMRSVAACLATDQPLKAFVERPMPPTDDGAREVDIKRLAGFFVSPAKHFFADVMGMHFPTPKDDREENEVFRLSELAGYDVKDRILRDHLENRGSIDERLFQRLRAEGLLPHGCGGKLGFDECCFEIDGLADSAKAKMGLASLDLVKQELNLSIDGFKISGKVDRMEGAGVLLIRAGDIRAKDRMTCCILHLALCAQKGPLTSIAIGLKEKSCQYAPLEKEKARALLSLLLKKYAEGGSRPFPFYLNTAVALYPRRGSRLLEPDAREALFEGKGGFGTEAEVEDPYIYTAVRHLENSRPHDAVSDPEFQRNAVEILDILYDCEKEEEKKPRSPVRPPQKTAAKGKGAQDP